MRTFFVVWAGQTLSVFGSALTGFALGIWGFQATGSATVLSLIVFSASAPGIVLSPFAGAVIDRSNRGKLMFCTNLTYATVAGVLAWLASSGLLQFWHLYVAAAIGSLAMSLHQPAYASSLPLLAPQRHLGRANGLVTLSQGMASLLAPLAAGALVQTISLGGILLADMTIFLVAAITLLLARIPRPAPSAQGQAPKPGLAAEAALGWAYLRANPGLLGVLCVSCLITFLMGFVTVLYTPLVLGIAKPVVLGAIMSTGGLGLVAGSVLVLALGVPRRKVPSMLSGLFLIGVALAISGLWPSPLLIGAGAFAIMAFIPATDAVNQTLWQTKVPLDLQGRVFALRRMVAMTLSPIAPLVAGPLADNVFNPLMMPDGRLAETLGRAIGVGPGRGIALMFLLIGLCTSAIVVAAYQWPRIRNLEREIPDAAQLRGELSQATEAAVDCPGSV